MSVPFLFIVQDTGTELMPQDIKYYQEFGGEKVIFEKEETTAMKKVIEKGECRVLYMYLCMYVVTIVCMYVVTIVCMYVK